MSISFSMSTWLFRARALCVKRQGLRWRYLVLSHLSANVPDANHAWNCCGPWGQSTEQPNLGPLPLELLVKKKYRGTICKNINRTDLHTVKKWAGGTKERVVSLA